MVCHICTKTGTQKPYADEKKFAEIAKKMTTQVTELINAQMNLSAQTVENDTWQEVTTVMLKKKESVIKKIKLITDLEDEELFIFWQEKMNLQNQTLSHTLHISDAKWIQKRKEDSTRGQ